MMQEKFSGLKIKIFTRSMNRDLYKMSGLTIRLPFERIRLTNTTSDGYFYEIIKYDVDYAINIDEDAFIIDNNSLLNLIEYVIENDIDNCGMPDGGVVPIRCHNPLVINPFFCILNVRKIKKLFSFNEVNKYKVHHTFFEKKTPFSLMRGKYLYDNFEPYYPFFVWISQNFKVLYLDAETHKDDISTILLNHVGRPFLIHSWYSRNYGEDPFHTNRINLLVEECGIVVPQRKVTNLESQINYIVFRIILNLRRILKRLGIIEYV